MMGVSDGHGSIQTGRFVEIFVEYEFGNVYTEPVLVASVCFPLSYAGLYLYAWSQIVSAVEINA